MKKLTTTILITMILISCNLDLTGEKEREEKKRKETIKAVLLYSFIQENGSGTTSHRCRKDSGLPNILYPTADYYVKFKADLKQYKYIIRGNSTMDISCAYPGFYDTSTTQCVAVSGNKLCDILEQTPAINTIIPDAMILSAIGGNDLLAHFPNSYIKRTVKDLIDDTRSKWPNTKIVLVGTHPTLMDYANANKGEINNYAKNYLATMPNTCHIDPLPIFGKLEGEAADQTQMIDGIHYNEAMSFLIKDEILNKCGVAL